MEKILSVNNLTFSYKNRIIFENVSLDFEGNTVNSIIGPNNCGKTTLIGILSGIFKSNKSIYYKGEYLSKHNIREFMLDIGVVFYNNRNKFLFDDVFSELVFPLENLNYSKKTINYRVSEILSLFNISDCINKSISDLSEFEKVKLSLATSIIHKPKILLLDDIFDTIEYSQYSEIIKILKNQKMIIIYTTNKLLNLFESDRVIVFDEKKIRYDLPPLELLEYDNVLSKIGIDIPLMIDLSLKLEFYNLIDQVIMTPERMVNTLWK